MRRALRIIDDISEWTGKTGQWFSVFLVLVVTYEVMMRYVFRAPSLWPYDTSAMLGTTLYVLAFAYALRHGAHVRVDVVYAHLPPRGRAIIDVLGDLLIFFPLIFLITGASISWMLRSWSAGEKIHVTGWDPIAGPIRTVVVIGFCVLALQGVAQFVRDLYFLIKGKAYD